MCISVFIFIYRKNCLLIKMGGVTLYAAYPLLLKCYLVINVFYKSDNENCKYISKINNFMTQTCNYKLYCNKRMDTYLRLTIICKNVNKIGSHLEYSTLTPYV